MPCEFSTRRELLRKAGIVAATAALGGILAEAGAEEKPIVAPSLPVALARCETYDLSAVTARLQTLLDQTGGAKKLASGKTVAIKVNLTGSPMNRFGSLPASRTFHIHPNVALALAMLLDKAGAKRIRFVEGTYSTQPMEKTLQNLGWELAAFAALHAPVEFEDTRHRGPQPYTLVKVPGARPVSRVPIEPFVCGLRHVHFARQAEEPCDGRRHALHEKQFRHHAHRALRPARTQ